MSPVLLHLDVLSLNTAESSSCLLTTLTLRVRVVNTWSDREPNSAPRYHRVSRR